MYFNTPTELRPGSTITDGTRVTRRRYIVRLQAPRTNFLRCLSMRIPDQRWGEAILTDYKTAMEIDCRSSSNTVVLGNND